ncbi:helix-turn-helix transcriptional regulator [Anaerofustis sp.]|uniref:helix-turn-helix domain-containing protein n=1 Tax=Anaerofustis sp. TaxID=1872517 RepID=UPI0025B7F0AF|nr:helix-turn-helix transcriptional regulator [Anaerofustis sp.]
MNKKQMSFKLKELRRNNKLTIEDVRIMLEKRNFKVASKTIYGWESGQRLPYPDIFLTLCDIYQVNDILETFGFKQKKENNNTLKMIARGDGYNTLELNNENLKDLNEHTKLITKK